MITTTIANPTERLVYTVAEAAYALRIGRSKLYELLASGEIESIHIGRSRKIPASALDDYLTDYANRRYPHEQTTTQRQRQDLPWL
ncbi:helix-turn-helix domain-containing protein [Streptantibioticus rubrisoli]|uniref:Helix-turn-helix domain-containing protein n=1 Tax=Streptantibioticus rubrisoli TaxID=1387313 RepID=A0ABT1PGI9_9ACTN|nr:helix-turn-helix domain-containing protein [Streptantibioticus rubrisoli]MCQ4044483.1 helix-turn-helix domain-containing protein [Streptantibioticus rubrisoli]